MILHSKPASRLPVDGDLYRLQRRPGHGQVIVNDSYAGLSVIDPWQDSAVVRARFSPAYAPSGVIDAWCLRADGGAAIVFNEEAQAAEWLDLGGSGQAFGFEAPPLPTFNDLRYFWEGDDFWLTGGKSSRFFRLEWREGGPQMVESDGMRARFAHPSWRRAAGIDYAPADVCGVQRVASDLGQLIYHCFAGGAKRVGMVNWRDNTVWSAPFSDEVPRMAFHGSRMYVLGEDGARAVDNQGEVTAAYAAPAGFRCLDLDTLPGRAGTPAALILACAPIGEGRDEIVTYALAPEGSLDGSSLESASRVGSLAANVR